MINILKYVLKNCNRSKISETLTIISMPLSYVDVSLASAHKVYYLSDAVE